jgi:hypothetical protein
MYWLSEINKIVAVGTDIVLHDRKEKNFLLISVAIIDDSSVDTKGNETLIKYKDLEIEDSGMLKVRTQIVPSIIGALGTMKKGLGRNLQLLQGHPASVELQKITLMNTAHSICKVLG